jgi:membrane protein
LRVFSIHHAKNLGMTTWFTLLKETIASWSAHNAQRMGAALAYYTAFSLAPLVVMIVGVFGLLVGKDTIRAGIVEQVSTLVGEAGSKTVDAILSNPAQQKAGIWATSVGFVVLLIGASGMFTELQDSLNTIWEVRARGARWRLLIRKRLLSFAMVLAFGFLVLLSLGLSSGIAMLRFYASDWVSGADVIWENAHLAVLLVLVTLLFAAVFRYLPDTHIAWRDVWIGAGLTALLFILGKVLLGLYFRHSVFASAYGAAGSLLVMLAWVYYSAQIFFLGAEFTHVIARRRASREGRVLQESRKVP